MFKFKSVSPSKSVSYSHKRPHEAQYDSYKPNKIAKHSQLQPSSSSESLEDSDDDRSKYNKKYDNSSHSSKPHKHSSKSNSSSGHVQHKSHHKKEEPRFTFDEVKIMIEKMLAKQTKATPAAAAGLRRINFDEIAAEGHSVEGCKDLIEQLVHNTRRVRTLQEVLIDIRDNLKRRSYTEIIARASIKGDLPKRPPSAYLLFHQDRYNQLKNENTLAIEVSKLVAEEWKCLSDKKRREYQRRHDELVSHYESEMQRLGLVDLAAPKRPKSAKTLFVDDYMSRLDTSGWTKEQISHKREKLSAYFENLDADEKQKWLDLHREGQENYLKAREEYVAAHPHLDHAGPDKKPRYTAKVKPPELPKSALKYFLMKKLPSGLEARDHDEALRRLKDKFQNLKDKKMLKYVKKAIQDKQRYEQEVEEFNKTFPDRQISKLKTNVTKEQWRLYHRLVENRPELPAPTAYLHYCGKILSDMNMNEDDQVPTRRMQAASEAWRKLSAREKRQATRDHLADIERYIDEMENWLSSQPEDRRYQLFTDEPKTNPDHWRKKLSRMKKKAEKLY